MATCGQFLSLIGISFFFLTILTSRLDRRLSMTSSLGIAR